MDRLSKLSKQQYLLGAKFAKTNSENHLSVAKLCKENKLYGIGISHLVLATEEFIKSSILYLRSIDNRLPIINLQKYFTSHKTKYESIDKFITGLFLHNISKKELVEIKKSITWKNMLLLIIFLKIIDKIFKEFHVESHNNSLEELRNFGFYVALSSSNTWRSPHHYFTEKDYRAFSIKVISLMELYTAYFESANKNKKTFDSIIDVLVNGKLIDKKQLEKIYKKNNN